MAKLKLPPGLKPDNLLGEAWRNLDPPADQRSYERSRSAMFAIWLDLVPVLQEKRLGQEGSAEIFSRRCSALRKRFEGHPLAGELVATHRYEVLGAYFDAAMKARRNAGRPPLGNEGLFVHVWHMLNLQRKEDGQPELRGRVPAKEIAAQCASLGWGTFTAPQVTDALRAKKRTLDCPYYGKNTDD